MKTRSHFVVSFQRWIVVDASGAFRYLFRCELAAETFALFSDELSQHHHLSDDGYERVARSMDALLADADLGHISTAAEALECWRQIAAQAVA